VADQSVSVPMTFSYLERRDESGEMLQADLLERPNWAGRHVWEGAYFWWVSHTPTARKRGPSASQFGELPSIYMHTPFDPELPNLRSNTYEGLVYSGEPRLHPKGAGS